MFARGTDNGLWTKVWDGSNWSGWINLGSTGELASGPSAVSWGLGRIDVVARLTNNTIKHWYFSGGAWNSDNLGTYLGGSFTSDPGISSWGPGRLDVFARGATSNKLFHAYYQGGWYGWEDMGGNLASGPAAVSWGSGRIDVVAVNSAGELQHWYWNNGWYSDKLGSGFESEPGISSWGTNRLDIFARDSATDKLFHKWWSGSAWIGWEDLGGSLTSGASAVNWAPGRVDAFGRITNNSVEHWWWG
jgi:hypothetical protein